MEEIEVKLLEIDPVLAEAELLKLGAVKEWDLMLEEWIYENSVDPDGRGRVRIRKTGNKTQMAYKRTLHKTSEGNIEIEMDVSDHELARQFLEHVGLKLTRHQKKRRIHFHWHKLSVDIDFWPMIPPYMEIEGENLAEIEKLVKKLKIPGKRVELDAREIYEQVYNIKLNNITELV